LDVNARRLVVLLHRAGLSKGEARTEAAKGVKGVLPASKGNQAEAIRYWQTNYSITADDEKLIARVISRYGNDRRHIVGWFIGLIRFAIDPEAARTARRVLIQR
jgi:hypothetical protein